MAAFLAKQMVGNQLSAVKDMKTETMTAEEKAKLEEEERERMAAIQEAEEARKEKHRKMEEEREKMRQVVREKYGIKKNQEKGAELRRQQEAEMARHIAAMNPRNASNSGRAGPNGSAAGPDDEDLATRLMNGNLSGATSLVLNKVQSFLPPNLNPFKQE